MIKIFGIGNPLLCDDGIGVKLSTDIEDGVNYAVFTGEIYVDYCLDHINEDDFIVIIDAVSLGNTIGTVSTMTFEQCLKFYPSQPFCHDASLLYLLLYSHINYKGCVIGVEVRDISYHDHLSDEINSQYETIKNNVIAIISDIKEDEYA